MIQIKNGKRGYHLMVDDLYISHGFENATGIKAIKSENGIPYGATEWVSISAIRNFWNKYMPMVIVSTLKPVRSVWGKLEFINT
jgi:hypothetical protein